MKRATMKAMARSAAQAWLDAGTGTPAERAGTLLAERQERNIPVEADLEDGDGRRLEKALESAFAEIFWAHIEAVAR